MHPQILRDFDPHCVQDEPPACQTQCPLHLDARGLAGLMAEGKLKEARKIIDRYLPLNGLTAYLCEGPCGRHCRRSELDQGVDVPLLERVCVAQTQAARLMPLPRSGQAVAVFGAGLSSLTLAWELGKKGHQVTIYHTGPAGGRLVGHPGLPAQAWLETLEWLDKLRVVFEEVAFSPAALAEARAGSQSVYLGFDDPALTPELLGLSAAEAEVSPVSLLTSQDKILAAPFHPGPPRFVDELAAGKRAAGSIDRLLQGVSPEVARVAEETYPSRLYTSLADIPVKSTQPPADPWVPTLAEAQAEAQRCLPCQCLECVKQCVYLQHYLTFPKKAAREIFNNISTALGNRTSNILALSCAECGLCREICPGQADTGQFVHQARQEMVYGRHMPISAHEFALEDMAFINSPEFSFFRHQPGRETSAYLFFPGCQLPASLPVATESVYSHLQNHLEGGVGFALACCGAPARWAARPKLTTRMVETVRGLWASAGQPRVILACASCAVFFQAELPEIPVETLWNVLAALPRPAGAAAGEVLAIHDPCAARHDQATQASVRELAQKISQPLEELHFSGQLARCCGYGGLAAAANPALGAQFAQKRLGDTDKPLLAYCIMCRDRLRREGRPTVHLLDLMFPGQPPAEAAQRPAPGLSDRQEGRRRFRDNLLKKLWGEEPPLATEMENIIINIPEEVAARLETRRILRSDIQRVLLDARERGPIFSHPGSGRQLAGLRPRQVTYWVEYSLCPDGSYDIHDAYCHRMVVPGIPGEGRDSVSVAEGFNPEGGRA
ncbi:MAG: 4Fe-4S dicluster domain-containing protein [Candidatus Adiutrix sp.]|nr:4Fe-4S dicluster domain-containing protein [Candidatus Adiutrix sp.]